MVEYSFKTPDLGEGIVEVELIKWYIAIGDEVVEDQPIADVMTDKANMELTSPVTGKVLKLACSAEAMVAVGAELVRFEVEDSASEGAPEEKKVKERYSATSVARPCRENPPTHKSLASPAVRRQALELDVDINRIMGTGPKGRVTHADVNQFQVTTEAAGPVSGEGSKQFKLTGIRRIIAHKMQASKRTIPHFSYVEEVDITELESLRIQLNEQRIENPLKLTLLPFLMQALVISLKQCPEVNATFDDETDTLTRHDAIHIGIATRTNQGLKVPVFKHAESGDIWDFARGLQRLTDAARDNTASQQELTGSTITISSLGKLGGIASTPIINKPEVAIIGINRAEDRVVVRQGQMAVRRMMNISSSFDHRIVDGHVAAELIQAIKKLLEYPAMLFIPQA